MEGRVLNALALGSDMKEALRNSYKQASQVMWSGVQMRSDIGARAVDLGCTGSVGGVDLERNFEET